MTSKILKVFTSILLVTLLVVVAFAQSATIGGTVTATQVPVFVLTTTTLVEVTLSTIKCDVSVDTLAASLCITCWNYAPVPEQLNTDLILLPPIGTTKSTFEVGPDKFETTVDSATRRFTMTGGGYTFMAGY